MALENRAMTDEQKEEVMRRILHAWKCLGNLRLGQLIIAANQGNPFYAEDFCLVERIEQFVKDHPSGKL